MPVVLQPQYDTFGIIFYNEDEHFLKNKFLCHLGKEFCNAAHNSDSEFINVQLYNFM